MLTQFLFLVVFFLINIFFNLMHYASLKIKLHNFFKLFSIKLPHSNELDCWLNRSTRIFSLSFHPFMSIWLESFDYYFLLFFFLLYEVILLLTWVHDDLNTMFISCSAPVIASRGIKNKFHFVSLNTKQKIKQSRKKICFQSN